MDLNNILQNEIEKAVAKQVASELDVLLAEMTKVILRPGFESWGRYLSRQQAMAYTGYSSRGGLKSYLERNKIRIIPNGGGKNERVDREDIDRAMMRDRVEEYKKQLKI
ncbi:MAG: hypothetical protein IPL46_07095 [Saprospiraceae bacterium]|nr:hypothetical protein [Saprospiraceae bacterium]